MNMPKFERPSFVAALFGNATLWVLVLGGSLCAGSAAQTGAPILAVSAHPAVVDCQNRFRSAAILANVAFVPSTMAEVCSTVEQSCKPHTEGNSDCQKAVANVGSHVAASFGSRETKLNRAR